MFSRVKALACRYGTTALLIIIAQAIHLPAGFAQTKTASIRGLVENEDGTPLAGVTITAENDSARRKNSTATSADGLFAFTDLDGAQSWTFTVSHTGYTTQQIKRRELPGGRTESLIITLKRAVRELDAIVVIGYGSQERKKLTGAVSKLDASRFKDFPITSFDQGMAGQMAGVDVIQATGDPGSNPLFRIRGTASISAGTQPLIVLDGLPIDYQSNLSNLNPADIESIEVLKDAAAASIYGSRGANGVILITTKTGKTGKAKFDFSTYYGSQQLAKKVDLMDAYAYARYKADTYNYGWAAFNPATNKPTDPNSVRSSKYQVPAYLQPYLNNQPGLTNTDWQDAIFRMAPQQSYQLAASGGDKNMAYYVSGNYYKQQGIVLGTSYERFSSRINLDAALTPKIKLGFNLNPTYANKHIVSSENYSNDGIVLIAQVIHPFYPVYDSAGHPLISNQVVNTNTSQMENPVALAQDITNTSGEMKLTGGANLDIALIKHLSFKTFLGGEYTGREDDYFRPSYLGAYKQPAPTKATGKIYNRKAMNWLNENTLRYENVFAGKHTLSALLGYTVQHERINESTITGTGYPNDYVSSPSLALAVTATSTISEWSLISYLGRIQYDYSNKYLLSVSLRSDGSSRFGDNHKWGYFPSVSGGWRLSNESFYPKNNVLTDLKLRGSWGMTGNFNIGDFAAIALLSPANYTFSNTNTGGEAPSTAPNANLSWERTQTSDAGIDMEWLHGKLFITGDYYNAVTDKLLLSVPSLAQSGYSTSLQNIGSVRNTGLELGITGKLHAGKLGITPSFNIAANRNTVLSLGPGQQNITTWYTNTEIGHPIGAFYGYQSLGVYTGQGWQKNYPELSTSKPGQSYVWQDVNKDGKIDANDRTLTGSPFPNYTFGFSLQLQYRQFDLSCMVQGVQGDQVFNYTRLWTMNPTAWSPPLKEMTDHYIDPTHPGKYVLPNIDGGTDNNYQRSSLLVEDGSFTRIKNLTLGYNLPHTLLTRIGLSRLRLYAAAQNPFTFTKYSGYNPEVSSRGIDPTQPGIDYGNYPVAKVYVMGVNMSF